MPLVADYAITPDVFDVTSYSTADECAARLESIREAMLTEGLVRDLRDGEWRALFSSDERYWHRRGTDESALPVRLLTTGIGAPSARRTPVLRRRASPIHWLPGSTGSRAEWWAARSPFSRAH